MATFFICIKLYQLLFWVNLAQNTKYRLATIDLSILIAVYKRIDELTELLNSLVKQSNADFEVLVIDDGSPTPLSAVVDNYKDQLNIHYYYKENSGPAQSRNFGMRKANGNYFIFLDSDTLVPENYIQLVKNELKQNYTDAFGGPDAADENFSALQKAISFSMTSILTTGGIRGGKKHVGRFQPRSFNMGLSKEAFEKTGGFGELRIGEDPDLSMTLWENGFKTRLFPEAKVYHKRRSTLQKFAKQVQEFGIARPILNQRHPQYKSLTFWFPSLFLIGLVYTFISILLPAWPLWVYEKLSGNTGLWQDQNNFIFSIYLIFESLLKVFYLFYFLAILILSCYQNKSIVVGLLSLVTTVVQFIGYGFGFLKSWISLNLFRLEAKRAFPSHFSK